MRLSNVLTWALLVATASLVTAHPVDSLSNLFASRADADASLLACDPARLDLLAREYLSVALFARMAAPERGQFKTDADYGRAWRAWHRRSGKLGNSIQRTAQQHDPGAKPEPEQFASNAEYDKAWRQWNRKTGKLSEMLQKTTAKHYGKMEKEQNRLIQKSAKKAARAATVAKWLGRGKGKAKREVLYVFDE
ncbi:hypothetical protein FOMPIDRAFT_1023624 [Fomitopsis schrenkii]|uniref:Uncharacterized protein n=1 Tax=Fomitopsis schrenkii TaxID=2126942 RepID=S8EBK6_FOMSC|nr:hypothetical protein FOMPIDRAFT_1023624 [Fomitopsis schrenkii]